MKEELKRQGMFSWNELLTTDVEAAKNFYSQLIGWETEDMPMEEGNYTVFKVGEEYLLLPSKIFRNPFLRRLNHVNRRILEGIRLVKGMGAVDYEQGDYCS